MKTILKLFPLIAILEACSSVPDVEYSYYLAKSTTMITVIQTVACNADKSDFIVLNSGTIQTAYFGNTADQKSIKIKDLGGAFSIFADSNIGFTFYDDGRLKGINQSTTGQGETIIKAAASLIPGVAAIAKFPGGDSFAINVRLREQECKTLEAWGGGKPVTFTYSGNINLATAAPGKYMFTEVENNSELRKTLPHLAFPAVTISARKAVDIGGRIVKGKTPSDVVNITLQKVWSVPVTVTAEKDEILNSNILIPNENVSADCSEKNLDSNCYELPIPKAALFGQQSFSLALSEAGSVTAITYGKTAGTAGALNSIGSLVNIDTQIDAAKATAAKNRADKIAQQQREVLCKAKPTECK